MKTSNNRTIAFFVIIVSLLSQLAFSQSNIIPWIPLAADEPQRATEVITTDQINIPVYPGSYLTSYYPATSSIESDKAVSSLATVFLVTSDEIDKVKQFYFEKLKKSDGWNLFEEYNVFVRGDLNDALSRTVPGVAIREETGESYDLQGADPKIVSSLRTRIKILYKP